METEESNIEQLLHKYFRDECDPDEIKFLNRWFQNQENEELFSEILHTYISDQDLKAPDQKFTKIESWKNIHHNITKDDKDSLHRINWQIVRKIAAAVAFIVISSLVYLYIDNNQTNSTVAIEETVSVVKQTEKGQKRKFALPDGSLVTLNSSSRLEVSPDFMKSDKRTVYLEGEAFFEVERMPNLPFVVHSSNLITTVLGTSFNIDAYKAEEIKVAVLTGKVLVAKDDINVELEPNQLAIYKEEEGILKTKYDHLVEFGWKDGILVFDKDNFDDLIRKLELWYGVDITVTGNAPKDSFSAKYNNISLEVLLEGLSFSGDFTYKLEGKQLFMEFK